MLFNITPWSIVEINSKLKILNILLHMLLQDGFFIYPSIHISIHPSIHLSFHHKFSILFYLHSENSRIYAVIALACLNEHCMGWLPNGHKIAQMNLWHMYVANYQKITHGSLVSISTLQTRIII